MTAEEKRGSMERDDGKGDQFPIGMRVLAVDDDPICLKVLETLLLRCQYHVTITNQAIKALDMLRENKDKFDLVISDVHMPDMDGFKLLELVGLEMDLPVIMLSANGETKAVMKGITHGACDYLLKPVRIEELRNIWQHVVRRRKFEHRDRFSFENGEDHEKPQPTNSEGTMQTVAGNGLLDHGSKANRKRKDQNDEDEEYCEENTHESEDPSSQKKPRVVWSVELHRKFVAAVNQLGIDKAVPKRILDLMNVEKLTRENVASHLQKYRLYLKRLSAVASQQANMAAALGGRDASFLHMGSYSGFGNFHSISPTGQLQGFTAFQSSGLPSRSNSNLLALPGLAPGTVQIGSTQNSNTTNTITDLSKFQHIASSPSNQHENLLQGIPTSLELDQLQQKQKRMLEANNRLPGVFPGSPNNNNNNNYNFITASNSSLLLPGNQHQPQLRGGLANQPSIVAMPSIGSERVEMTGGVSGHLPDFSRCNETWQSSPSMSGYNINGLSAGGPYNNDNMASSNIGGSLSSTVTQFSTGQDSLSVQTSSLAGNALLVPSMIDADHKFLNFRGSTSLKPKADDPKQHNAPVPNVTLSSSLSSSSPNRALLSTVSDSQRLQGRIQYKKADGGIASELGLDGVFMPQHARTSRSHIDSRLTFSEESMMGASKLQSGFSSSNCNFDELMNAMIKPERDDIVFVDGEMGGSDLFPLSTCM